MIIFGTRMNVRMHWATADDDDDELLPLRNDCASTKHEYSIKIHFDQIIFTASCMMLLIVLQLPMSSFRGMQLQVFGGLPSAFHAFLICLMGACYGSVCSIHMRKTKPKVAIYYHAFAVLSMVASFAIAFCATVWEMYKALALLPVFAGIAA